MTILLFNVSLMNGQYIATKTASYNGNIYHTGGFIGIGTTQPQSLLHLTVDHNIDNYWPALRLENIYTKSFFRNFWEIENKENLLFYFGDDDMLKSIKMLLTPESQLILGDSIVESSAILELSSNNKGVLIPRLTKNQIDSISNPVNGLLVFNIEKGIFEYYYDGEWRFIINDNYANRFLTKTEFYNTVASGITAEDTARWNEAFRRLEDTADLIWQKSGTDVYLKDNSSKVGIGTTDPESKLHLKAPYSTMIAMRLESKIFNNGGNDTISDDTLNIENKNASQILDLTSYWDIKKVGPTLGFYYNNEQNPLLKIVPGSAPKIYFNGEELGKGLWNENENNIFYNDGNVGIGTDNPESDIEIHKDIYKEPELVSEDDCGSFRIGFTLNDQYNSSYEFRQNLFGLHIKSIKKFPDIDTVIDIISFGLNGGVGIAGDLGVGKKISAREFGSITIKSSVSYDENLITIKQNDEIKLKITNTGKLYAKKVVISVNSFKDEVFYPDYKLIPIDSLENFVKQNYHLPDIPPEKDVVNQGLDIGQMQTLQMQKIEELTLYIIELNKQIKQLQQQNQKLQQELSTLKSKN